MNKKELVAAIAEKAGITNAAADKALAALVATVEAELKAGGKVQLVGFGTFEVRERAARNSNSPSQSLLQRHPCSKLVRHSKTL